MGKKKNEKKVEATVHVFTGLPLDYVEGVGMVNLPDYLCWLSEKKMKEQKEAEAKEQEEKDKGD